jgi:hypothetical protein
MGQNLAVEQSWRGHVVTLGHFRSHCGKVSLAMAGGNPTSVQAPDQARQRAFHRLA